ncbi:MAG: prepilin-type N-terminal cleavage/methylation domain-containing protein [Xylanivirga thermophila]|jgi:prepilin-type N-terminal cleavage/methylation domain-containing protein|uniref:type II secretion system protein n=1 Tax=Xylanivirga thermophila TaxID=2496273 RepID=UPI00101CE3B7|nr:prepilin-type N-terminal cleavage/methylation domain-containing protein [Xylanivirga thermophila]
MFDNKGFTLIELIVVICILGILSTIVLPRMMDNVQTAKDTVADVNARTLANIIQIYNAEQTDQSKIFKSQIIKSETDKSKIPDEIKERIPKNFDWTNMSEVNVDEKGDVEIKTKLN